MPIYTILPVIEIRTLEEEIKNRFDINVEDRLTIILFGHNYQNDCYKSYSFQIDEEFHGLYWENEEHIHIRNLVNAYLRDILPNYAYVLIDITW